MWTNANKSSEIPFIKQRLVPFQMLSACFVPDSLLPVSVYADILFKDLRGQPILSARNHRIPDASADRGDSSLIPAAS